MIYFVQLPTGGIKIGTTENLAQRLDSLRTAYRGPVALLATMPGGREEEAEIHSHLADHRMGRTEQFRPTREVLDFIDMPLLVHPDPDAVEVAGLGSFKAPDDLVQMLRLIAVKRRLSLPDAFDSLCRETIDKAHLEVARDISRAIPRADKS